MTVQEPNMVDVKQGGFGTIFLKSVERRGQRLNPEPSSHGVNAYE